MAVVHVEPADEWRPPPGIWIGSAVPETTNICVQLWPASEMRAYQCLSVGALRALVRHLETTN